MNKDFLLSTELAKKLYYDCAENLPIIDYHNHLSAKYISDNKRFTDIYDLWIAPDPYKHRAMRMMGVPEKLITGESSAKDKFTAWCCIFPKLVGNPLYIWSLMELDKVFGFSDIPCADNAEILYKKLNLYLEHNRITVNVLFERFSVEFLCPCCSVTDSFSAFKTDKTIAPSLRGDDAVFPDHDFVRKLENASGVRINTLDDYKKALKLQLCQMKDVGCKFADHALDDGFIYYNDDGKNAVRFELARLGKTLSEDDGKRLFSHMLTFLASEYARCGFVLLLHIGAKRHTSTLLRKKAGPAGGYAAIGNSVNISSLTSFLDTVEQTESGLPRIMLFTLNPSDNAIMSTLSGSYSKDGVRGLITQGPAWWWCDHKQGIYEMLEHFSSYGLLSNFIGMTTDSRSFLSFVRHDYFRRILCDFIAKKALDGDFPDNFDTLSELIRDLCYNNAKNIWTEDLT